MEDVILRMRPLNMFHTSLCKCAITVCIRLDAVCRSIVGDNRASFIGGPFSILGSWRWKKATDVTVSTAIPFFMDSSRRLHLANFQQFKPRPPPPPGCARLVSSFYLGFKLLRLLPIFLELLPSEGLHVPRERENSPFLPFQIIKTLLPCIAKITVRSQ